MYFIHLYLQYELVKLMRCQNATLTKYSTEHLDSLHAEAATSEDVVIDTNSIGSGGCREVGRACACAWSAMTGSRILLMLVQTTFSLRDPAVRLPPAHAWQAFLVRFNGGHGPKRVAKRYLRQVQMHSVYCSTINLKHIHFSR